MSRNASTSNHTMQNKFESTSTNGLSQVSADQQLYGGKWVGKKRDFLNMPIYTYESLGSVGHIMIGKPTKLSTNATTIELTIAKPPWSTLYERGVSWRSIVNGTSYEFLRHAQPSYLEMNLPTYLLILNKRKIKCKGD